MKALTLIQPWGGLIATGVKRIENRSWEPPRAMIGERFAIHAGRSIDRPTILHLVDEGEIQHQLWSVRSAILAVATLSGFVDEAKVPTRQLAKHLGAQRRWFVGPVGFILTNIVALRAPVPCKGSLGFWRVPSDVETEVARQVGRA